jgi:hypothetical protein
VRGKEGKKRLKKAYQKFGNLGFYSYVSFVMRELKMILILVLIATDNECRMKTTPIQIETLPRIEMINKPL